MPYKSDAQRKFMHAAHPDIAKKWDKKYGPTGDLPEHVKPKKKKTKEKKKPGAYIGSRHSRTK